MPLSAPRGDAQELDAVAHVLGRLDVGLGDRLDALDVDLVEGDLGAEGEARQDGELVGGVEAADVEGRIGLGVAARLRLLQHLVEGAVLVLHGGEDVIAGAVEDAVDAAHLVGAERLPQRLDDGDAAGDRRLEVQGDAVLLGELGERHAVLGEQRLVGGHDVLARASAASTASLATPSEPPISSTNTAMPGSLASLTGSSNQRASPSLTPRSFAFLRAETPADADLPPGPLLEPILVLIEQVEEACADGAKAGDAQGERLLHGNVTDYRLAFCGIGITLCMVSGA